MAPTKPVTAAGKGRSRGPSIEMVAREAGVSIATVSRVLNGINRKASAATIARVQEVVAELGYRPSRAGSALRSQQSKVVAVLAPNAASTYMAAVAASVEAALRVRGLTMILCDTQEDPAIQDEHLLEMRAHMVRGIVMLGAVESPVLTAFLAADEPIVFVNRKSPGERGGGFVGIDNLQAGKDVADYLANNDLLPCAVIHGDASSSATAERLSGFRARLAVRGIRLPAAMVGTMASHDHLEIGGALARELLTRRSPPRSIFCVSDLIAYGAFRYCREAGLRVPEDVMLFGFDDNPLNDWIAPWLSTVHVPYESFGDAVVGAFERIWQAEGRVPPTETLLPYRLVTRTGES